MNKTREYSLLFGSGSVRLFLSNIHTKTEKVFCTLYLTDAKKICIIEENPLPPVRAGSIYFGVLRSW